MAGLYLDPAQHRLVSDAVARAEQLSSGEIVTVVADRSDGYSDIALAWSALIALTALVVLAWFPGFYLDLVDSMLGDWNHVWTPSAIFGLAASVAILKFVAVWAIQLWQPLKFAVIPGPIKTARVRDRAISLFRIGAERKTTGRTGIVIYLSMREHRAEIVADEAIASRVDPEVWGDAMAAMVEHLRQGRIAEGMIAAVEHVGAVLAEHFPRAEGDRNELPDRLVEL
ncbi:TPM domain-containing protein [Altericroceibacterium xinjiangense]|uniref:TPM domain-containing protein n=1 Tax=Altericroceibacterium xinjiangense TaxID=762261 RepID=UPI000F7F8DCB|nr:TPM domain-containing protein [Altericroceibacterium xinjiangense]